MMERRQFLMAATATTVAALTGAYYWSTRWRYITVHHSAGSHGDIAFLQQVHRERQWRDPIDAIPYHYVIGNGNGMGMGEIASDWRRYYGIWGAHVSARNRDRNLRGIGICLIGNFELTPVPPRQYEVLVSLTRQLMAQYAIPPQNVAGHGHIPGEQTQCPGRLFPMERFLREIQQ